MIENGTKVKIKNNISGYQYLDKYRFGNILEVGEIEISEVIGLQVEPRYLILGLYFYEDELEVYPENKFPEYYI